MSIIETIVRIFAPHICLGCGVEDDRLLCGTCARDVPAVLSSCYRCHAPTNNYSTCSACVRCTPLNQVLARTHYQGLAKSLVRCLKFERAQAAVQEMADLLTPLLPCLPSDVVVTHIPTASGRVRSRGYDHARLLARALSARGSLRHHTVLARAGQARQVGANRAERLSQLEHAFRVVRPELIKDRHIVLVDDVLTTGATVESAARVLLDAGAARVSVIVFARA